MNHGKLRLALVSPKGPLYRHRGGIFGQTLRYMPLTLPTLAALVPSELNAEIACFDEGIADVDPARKPGTNRTAQFCPNAHGGKNWPPIAFNPNTRMIYIPANNNLCGELTGVPVTYEAGKSFAGSKSGPAFLALVRITSARSRPGTSIPARRSGNTTSRRPSTGDRC